MMAPRPGHVFPHAPALCGHRGAGKGEGENTLRSFRAAVAAGLGWVEVDARVTADDVLVARHDPVVPDGRFVADLRAEEADELGLMRVADLLEDLPPEVGLDIDLKSSLEDAVRPSERTTAGLVGALAARERERRPLLVTSFDPGALLAVRELAPGVPLGWLTWLWFPLRKAIAGAASLGLEVVAPHIESFPLRHGADPPVEPDIAVSVDVAHRAGLEVLVWCPSEADAALLDEAGVDGFVIDDVPDWRYAHPGAAETRQERLA